MIFDALGRFALGQFRKFFGRTPDTRRIAILSEDRRFAVNVPVKFAIIAEDRRFGVSDD